MMESHLPFREKFEQILRRHLRLVAAGEPIAPDDSLVSLGLDSIGTISLLLDIEEEFGISLPTTLVTPEPFRTRAALERAVAALVFALPPATASQAGDASDAGVR
jgi:acyl carrier protein